MKTGRLLFAIQYWSGDAEQAAALARLLAQLTLQANGGQRSPHADIMLVARYDAELDIPLIQELGLAFQKVRTFRCRNRKAGWPAGPNNMASEVFLYFCEQQLAERWAYSGLFLGEPDSAPLRADCLKRIHAEWCATDKLILGSVIGSFPEQKSWNGSQHTNGNCCLSHKLVQLDPYFLRVSPLIAWDAHWRGFMLPNTQPSTEIFSDYKLGDQEKNPWRGCDHLFRAIEHFDGHPLKGISFTPSWLHGPKTPEAIACVRERLLARVAAP